MTNATSHPAAKVALNYLQSMSNKELIEIQSAFAAAAIGGNELGKVCALTITRLLLNEALSDLEILGLAWSIWHSNFLLYYK